jgi:hypothetical protein
MSWIVASQFCFSLLDIAFWAEKFCMNDLPWRCAEQCDVSGLRTAGTGVTDAHQHVTTERAVADLAPFVFRCSHFQIWTYLFVILTNSFCERFRDNSRKYVGSTDVFFRLVTYKSSWNGLREVACLSKKQLQRQTSSALYHPLGR